MWRLGLDVGSNSIGWAAIELDEKRIPIGLIDAGVRVFSDGRNPKDMQSLAVQRRLPRGARRNRDRKLKRRDRFMDALIAHGLMPLEADARKELETLDPWVLRANGLERVLTPHEFGRALFHLNQRRGFKSNRKTDKDDGDTGKIAVAREKLGQNLKAKDAETLGQLFGRPRSGDEPHHPTRARLHGAGAKSFYEFYPTRDLILDEFDALWRKQRDVGLNLPEAESELRDILSFQRPLRPQPVGRCTLDPDDLRAPWALPSVQRRRIHETVNALSISYPEKRALTHNQRAAIIDKALKAEKVTFDQMRRTLKLPKNVAFSIESEKRKHIDGDVTAARLAKEGKAPLWGKGWRDLPLAEQDALAELLLGQEPLTDATPAHIRKSAERVIDSVAEALGIDGREAQALLEQPDETALAAWIADRYGFEAEKAARIVAARLPDGHANLGRAANAKVLAALEAEPITYDKAVLAAGYHDHRAHEGQGVINDKRLPYYGEVLERSVAFGSGSPNDPVEQRVGKLANPTVHIALNQIRKVVNALMNRYGPPEQIVIELARDLPMSGQAKRDLEREQADNQKRNEEYRKIFATHGVEDSYANRLKMRLWEEMPVGHRCCILTGTQISESMLLSADGGIEIDHILPFSQTLDDGFLNKMLATRQANRDKARRTPYEARHDFDDDWETILDRASYLPPNKNWRFAPDAMERYEDEERGFLARQLNDTKYIARLTRAYLGSIYGGGDAAARHVWVTPGRLTGDLRQVWGLNTVLSRGHNRAEDDDTPMRKNRDDHRHHAIDAIVIALTDRATLKAVADYAKTQDDATSELKLLSGFPAPWEGLRNDVERTIHAITVSHKKEHGLSGQLHEDTAYGVVADPETGEPRLASRKPITALTSAEIKRIGDDRIRRELSDKTKGLSGKELTDALTQYSTETGHRRVRVHKVEADYRVIEHGPERQHRKAVIPGENYCLDVFETEDGVWRCAGIARFDANQGKGVTSDGFVPPWRSKFPDALFVMRLHKNDLICVEDNPGERRIMRVVRLEPSNGRIRLAEHIEAGEISKRHDDGEDLFRWDLATVSKLKARKARLLHVDPIGRVYDPGPHDAGANSRGGD